MPSTTEYTLKTKLDAVNLILRKLGEPPIGSLDTQYPSLDLILPALDEEQRNLLEDGWWFNTFEPVTLSPDQNSRVTVPPDTLLFEPTDAEKYLWTGEYIRTLDGSLDISESVTGRRVANLPFEELPSMVRTAITYGAALHVYGSDVGVDDIYQSINQLYVEARREMGATHTRQRNYSSRRKKQPSRWHYFLRS
jgi:hypothetical protein